MKKTLRIIGLACAALAFMPLVSCGDDDDDVKAPGDNEIEKETGMRLTHVGNYVFTYDEAGRCDGMSSGGSYSDAYKINWDKGTIEEVGEDMDEAYGPLHFKTNGKGYVTEVSQSWNYKEDGESYKGSGKATFHYDGSGQLTEVKVTSSETGYDEGEKYNFKGEASYKFTWKNGNLVSAKIREEESEDGEKDVDEFAYEIEYDNQKNLFRQVCESISDNLFDFEGAEFAHVGMFGVGTSNFPTLINENENNGSYTYTYNVDVTLNENGLIDVERINGTAYDYVYDSVGTPKTFSMKQANTAKKKSLFPRHRKANK